MVIYFYYVYKFGNFVYKFGIYLTVHIIYYFIIYTNLLYNIVKLAIDPVK